MTSDKKVSFISESEGSYMDVVSTAYKPRIRIVYNKLLKATKNLPDTEISLEEFIDIKGMKAQGNQMTKLKVKEIILDHKIDGGESWPEAEKIEPTTIESEEDEISDTVEWDVKPVSEDDLDQPKLF